ncbi:hypothetical protein GCM10010869_34330 [Mesorhizobium tianshanense]|nr:hypothetical protein GCM10010869_34330 [Mesorhizobium tianshanense]
MLALLGGTLGFVVFATGRIAPERSIPYATVLLPRSCGSRSLEGDAEKQRPIPLTRDGAVREMLTVRSTAKGAALTSFAPSLLRHHTEGMAVAASNASEPISVVGLLTTSRRLVNGTAMQHALHGQRAPGTAEMPGETFLPFDINLLENK